MNLIEQIHLKILHQGTLKALDVIKELRITYKGIYNDLEKIRHLYAACIEKNIKFYKCEPSKQIIMPKHKERIVIDLTYIPNELCKNVKYKYILNCLEHFSKYFFSFLTEKKKLTLYMKN